MRILHDYLEYAATGRIEVGTDTGQRPESPFEEYVLERLRTQGLEVDPQVGVAGYRIDLGIRHPGYPHGYLLGVECDGRTYHSALSVRDRDRLREAVLRGLGWDIYRIWSTDWFKDPDHEVQKLMAYVEDRIKAWSTGLSTRRRRSGIAWGGHCSNHYNRPRSITSLESEDELGDEQLSIEVGDTVSYHDAGISANIRRVTIVRGVDNPANGIINDNKPLAIALLGAEVGETVTVRQPNSEVDIVVARYRTARVGTRGTASIRRLDTGGWLCTRAVPRMGRGRHLTHDQHRFRRSRRRSFILSRWKGQSW